MPSPLPGMDPYLETPASWPLFHHQIIVGLAEALQPSLRDPYRQRFACRAYKLHQPLFTSVIEEEHKESFLELRCRATDRLVTQVEVISPANRTHPESRKLYLRGRQNVDQTGS